jgi:cytochrome c
MKTFAEGGKTWSFDELNKYLTNPKADVPGNKMAFPGLKKDDERANVIAYLNTLSDTPLPLPAAQ